MARDLFLFAAQAQETITGTFDARVAREMTKVAQEQRLALIDPQMLATALVGWLEQVDPTLAKVVAADAGQHGSDLIDMLNEIPDPLV